MELATTLKTASRLTRLLTTCNGTTRFHVHDVNGNIQTEFSVENSELTEWIMRTCPPRDLTTGTLHIKQSK